MLVSRSEPAGSSEEHKRNQLRKFFGRLRKLGGPAEMPKTVVKNRAGGCGSNAEGTEGTLVMKETSVNSTATSAAADTTIRLPSEIEAPLQGERENGSISPLQALLRISDKGESPLQKTLRRRSIPEPVQIISPWQSLKLRAFNSKLCDEPFESAHRYDSNSNEAQPAKPGMKLDLQHWSTHDGAVLQFRGTYFPCSNLFVVNTPLRVSGVEYPSLESAFHACKALIKYFPCHRCLRCRPRAEG